MTTVVNLCRDSYTIYIGRGSEYGNPFPIGKGCTREESIENHKVWLNEWVLHRKEIVIGMYSNKWVIEHLEELVDEILGCFCKPKFCHGDTLIELIKKILGKRKRKGLLD